MADSAEVRSTLIDTLRRDLIGPSPGDGDLATETLKERPSRWYLTGYLVPLHAPDDQREGTDGGDDSIDAGGDADGQDDAAEPDAASARRAFLPSSIGLSVLVGEGTAPLHVVVTWGDYQHETVEFPIHSKAADELSAGDPPSETDEAEVEGEQSEGPNHTDAKVASSRVRRVTQWHRIPRCEHVDLDLSSSTLRTEDVPNSKGLKLAVLARQTQVVTPEGGIPARAVSVFVVNERVAKNNPKIADEAFAFQVQLSLSVDESFVPRPNTRGLQSKDLDERIGDLHYRDAHELAVGHNISADWEPVPASRVWTTWTPIAAVPRLIPSKIECELGMEPLGALPDAAAASTAVGPLVTSYRSWIAAQAKDLAGLGKPRAEVATALLGQAEKAAKRIEEGINSLADPQVLDAFRIANRTVAAAARRRVAQERKISPTAVEPPAWRPFQLAFILLNIKGLDDPKHPDRETVDLLFFPTGGGKTEAYLGLAAFTIALRRLRNPGLTGAGLCVLMRYSLRLLTLDQLGRAAAVICALELERLQDTGKLGTWPIEIALWVGRAATPNRMGHKGDSDQNSARLRVIRHKNNSKLPAPLPIGQCPWCGEGFTPDSYILRPDASRPLTLDLHCANRICEFHSSKRRPLPIQAIDEPIYRRQPAFMIATLDKFAAMPWTGETASFFGGADRADANGFYRPHESSNGDKLPTPLKPPDLVIQDELHLVSGPLGTMVGLYETALDTLNSRDIGGKRVRPKIVASTATVRQAQRQIRALFSRPGVGIFPPPGPDRRHSFFAEELDPNEPAARRYFGIAAPGGSPKVVFLRAMVSLMAAAQKLWEVNKGSTPRPGDPYMTVVAYFNALRELGGARRIVEGEVGPRLENYARRLRVNETDPPFVNRRIQYEPVELTSRIATDEVARAKGRLSQAFENAQERVDVALATNMISVGLDIVRLGLMVVVGQPKSAAEYIQATSRVGRDANRPGLVVVLLNVNKPRDRSHYERFKAWHQSFYRAVEATSVTPFSPRALDRGLAAVTVAISRLGTPALTPQQAAGNISICRAALDRVVDQIGERAAFHDDQLDQAEVDRLKTTVRGRVADLLDEWTKMAAGITQGGRFGYDRREVTKPLLREVLDPDLKALTPAERKFRAPRSLRDVEPSVLLAVQTPEGQPLEVTEAANE